MRAVQIIVACSMALASPASGLARRPDYCKLIVGLWQGPRHVEAFYPSGEFTLDPEPGVKPLGSWLIVGDVLTTRYPGDEPETRERIVELTSHRMVREWRGRRFTWTRIEQ